MREVGTHPEEDISDLPPQNRPSSCTRVIRFGLESLNYARVANHARTTALTSRCEYHTVCGVCAYCARVYTCVPCTRVCLCVTNRGQSRVATHGRTHEPGSPWNAGSRRCCHFTARKRSLRSDCVFWSCDFVPRKRNRKKKKWTKNEYALYRADESTRDTFEKHALARAYVCVRARTVDVVSLSLEWYADDFCSSRRDTSDQDFQARCNLTGNALRVTCDARGSIIEWWCLPVTTRSLQKARALRFRFLAWRTIVFLCSESAKFRFYITMLRNFQIYSQIF